MYKDWNKRLVQIGVRVSIGPLYLCIWYNATKLNNPSETYAQVSVSDRPLLVES